MNQTKHLKCPCQQCGGHLAFPAEAIGQVVDCPHCGQATELTFAPSLEASAEPAKGRAWLVAGLVILGIGLLASLGGLAVLKKLTARHPPPAPAAAANRTEKPSAFVPVPASANAAGAFSISPINLEQGGGRALVYATGTLKNEADRQRFGVKVELDLFDAAGEKVGTATDYQATLEPQAVWHFKALVVEGKAASAKLGAIREDQ